MLKHRHPYGQHGEHKISIFRRVILLFILAIALNSALLFAFLYAGGIFQRMHERSLSILAEVTRNKYQTLQSKMIYWSNLDGLEDEINSLVSRTLASENSSYDDIQNNPTLNAKLAASCIQSMITHISLYDISGVYVILDGMGATGASDSYAGLYLRDSDPNKNNASNSDLHMLRGLPPLSRAAGITLDSCWQATFSFPGGKENPDNDFFFKPLQAYAENANGAAKYYGFWSGRFTLNENDHMPIITYSRPLIAADGKAYGVIGIEANLDYVKSVVNNGEYCANGSGNSYFLGMSEDGGVSYQNILTVGMVFRQNFLENQDIVVQSLSENMQDRFVTLYADQTENRFVGAVDQLALYSPNTTFSGQQWALIGMQEWDALFEMETDFRTIVLAVAALGLAVGCIIALLAARGISRPISALIGQLRCTDHTLTQALEPTGITEVDVLADTISELSLSLVEDASKISKIITLSGLPVGAFEMRDDQSEVFCSDGFFNLLYCQELYNENNYLLTETFNEILRERLGDESDEGDDIYLIKGIPGMHYVRLKMLRDQKGVIGTLMDVTEEIESRRRIEHDRDYDPLTNLFNRRAFEMRAEEMFKGNRERIMPVAALMMLDMDNLKACNDSYGHDCGDLYIRTFAEGLEALRSERCLMARRSGDEFYLFYYGYESRDEIRSIIHEGWKKLMAEKCLMPDGVQYKIRASAGIAWYPEDATEFTRLVHYADFAMYRVKNSVKGSVEEFSSDDYSEAGYLFNGSQALDRLLDDKLVRYMFQPIVSAVDGSVYGYEMLMRPMVSELPTPTVVLNLAKEQGKLYRVERMTWEVTLSTAQEFLRKDILKPGIRLFINSIASQLMTVEDEKRLHAKYLHIYPDLVLEITEGEQNNDSHMSHKIDNVRRSGGAIAIDDFGTGYNSDTTLINIEADYVKLDIYFVRDVNREPNKRALISSVVQYAKRRNMLVIAEGVETYAEMETLSKLGIDYFQGYYLARPDYIPSQPAQEVMEAVRRVAEKNKSRREGLKVSRKGAPMQNKR